MRLRPFTIFFTPGCLGVVLGIGLMAPADARAAVRSENVATGVINEGGVSRVRTHDQRIRWPTLGFAGGLAILDGLFDE